jgi:hypothetical protein
MVNSGWKAAGGRQQAVDGRQRVVDNNGDKRQMASGRWKALADDWWQMTMAQVFF